MTDQWENGFDVPFLPPGLGDMQGGLPRVRMPGGRMKCFACSSGESATTGGFGP